MVHSCFSVLSWWETFGQDLGGEQYWGHLPTVSWGVHLLSSPLYLIKALEAFELESSELLSQD